MICCLQLPRVVMETSLFCMVAFFLVGVEGGSLGYLMFSLPAIVSAITSTAYGISSLITDTWLFI